MLCTRLGGIRKALSTPDVSFHRDNMRGVMVDFKFTISKSGSSISFINYTQYRVKISFKPIKPKRKYLVIDVVQPKSFVILEEGYPLNLALYSFEFEDNGE